MIYLNQFLITSLILLVACTNPSVHESTQTKAASATQQKKLVEIISAKELVADNYAPDKIIPLGMINHCIKDIFRKTKEADAYLLVVQQRKVEIEKAFQASHVSTKPAEQKENDLTWAYCLIREQSFDLEQIINLQAELVHDYYQIVQIYGRFAKDASNGKDKTLYQEIVTKYRQKAMKYTRVIVRFNLDAKRMKVHLLIRDLYVRGRPIPKEWILLLEQGKVLEIYKMVSPPDKKPGKKAPPKKKAVVTTTVHD